MDIMDETLLEDFQVSFKKLTTVTQGEIEKYSKKTSTIQILMRIIFVLCNLILYIFSPIIIIPSHLIGLIFPKGTFPLLDDVIPLYEEIRQCKSSSNKKSP